MKVTSEKAPPRRRSPPKWPLLLLGPTILYYAWQWTGKQTDSFDLDQTLLSIPDAEHARAWSAFYTTGSHLPSQGLQQAQWTQERWEEFGLEARILSYDAKLPNVTGPQRVALIRDSHVLYEASLVDGEGDRHSFAPAYYGFSANGNITASYVFANFGFEKDFEALVKANITLAGKIAVVKAASVSPYLRDRGINIFRGQQIRNCASQGLVGVLVYPDPQSDGPITDSNGYEPFPDGPARPPSMIERGSIGGIGKFEKGDLPTIPCMPISYADAIPILSALNGHGPSASDLDEGWHGGGLKAHGVHYHVGPSPNDIKLNIISHADINPSQVHNVIATIPGSISDEAIILGNHRDSWGPGAGDPGSGSAALNEVIRSFGVALRQGWRPRRTLVFASWEGEEFGQVGSLAWINENMPWLNATGAAYLNIVVAAGGTSFHAKASPLLHGVLHDATQRVQSPNQTVPGQSVLDAWDKRISMPGGGDAICFQGAACVSSLDFGFIPGLGDNPFPYHSGYDTHEWMDQYGDPGWQYHVASARIWSLIAARLTETPILSMKASRYAVMLQKWLDNLVISSSITDFDLTALYAAVERFSRAAKKHDTNAASLSTYECPWWHFWSDCGLEAAISRTNKKYMEIERCFCLEPGQELNSSRHMLYNPAAWYADSPAFPGLRASLSSGNLADAGRWSVIYADAMDKASALLGF